MRARVIVLAACAAVLALTVGTVVAGPKGTDRPFKGASEGTSEVEAIDNGGNFRSESSGTLNASHLGKGSYEIASTQSWTFDFEDLCTEDESNIIGLVSGDAVFTAANGDEVHGTIEDGSYVCEVGTDDTTYATTLVIEITGGGTGKFTNATGQIVATGTSAATDAGLFDDSGSFTGTISY